MTSSLNETRTASGLILLAPVSDGLVYQTREPDPAWITRLRDVSPKSDVHSWLYLTWFAHKQRWVLYEMVPEQFVDEEWRAELEGAHPDTLEPWAVICSAFQWEMWRKFRCHARPSWIIQGTKGGHLAAYDKPTEQLCRAMNLPPEPPKAGELPYAPFDERVVGHILRMNKLIATKNDLSEFRKRNAGEGFKSQYKDALKQARAQMVQWLEAQMDEPMELYQSSYRKGEWDDAPVSDTDWVKKDEIATRNFIETGSLTQDPDA